MARLPFVKMQAVGNDFVVVDARDWPDEAAWYAAALFLCDRKFGVGSDGLLVVGPSAIADVRMQMFNPDGTEDMCGNGLRCVVRYAFDNNITGSTSRIETLAGVRRGGFHTDGQITTSMGAPRFAPADIPLNLDAFRTSHRDKVTNLGIQITVPGASFWGLDTVNTGSTHAVIWRDAMPADEEFFLWSPLIENAAVFPERTSVMWAVVESDHDLRLRIWERGAGETLGCGTGACAAAVLARQTGRITADQITVHSKGGTLHVAWAGGDDDQMFLTGTAHTVYEGTVDYSPPAKETARAEN